MTGNLEGTVQIGALVPVSGDASAHGTEIKITIDLAESDFNDYLAENGVNWRLDIVVEDTASSPVIALDKVSGLKAKGITAIAGTYSSSELRNIKGYTEPNDMLLISYGSTAPSLSLAGDNIFRFVPDETKQAPAIAQYLTGIGVTNLVPIWRGDAWGDGFIDAVRSEMTAAGGATGEGVRYNPEALEFSTEIAILADQVKPLIDEVGADKVAIMVVTFSEVTPIMQTASQYESLSQVLWLGTDTIVNDGEFSGDAIAQEFVNKAGLVVTSYAPASTTISEEISERAMEITGQAPNIYAITAYDVVWALGLSILAADSTETDAIVSAMPGVLEDYSGGLGSIVLNDAGDMGVAVYDIFTVRDLQWTLIGSYDSATDSLVLEDAMKDDEMMDDAMKDDEMMDDAMKDDEMMDDAMKDDEMMDDAMKDDEMMDDAMKDDEMMDDAMKDDEMMDDAMKDDEMMDDAMKDDEMMDDAMKDDEMMDDAMKDDEMMDDAMKDDEMMDDAMKDDEMMDDAMKDDEMMDDETDEAAPSGGGCLIATAAYGSELAPQVQFLREIRDNTLLSTASGTSFMTGFNQFYYSFSPAVADLERENAVFRDAVRVAITPALYTLNIMTLADQNSDSSVLAFGLLAIAAMAGIYIAGPLLATRAIVRKIKTAR